MSNTVALIDGLMTDAGVFERTPKHDVVGRRRQGSGYRSQRGGIVLVEMGLGLWVASSAVLALVLGFPWTAGFHALFAIGLGWVSIGSLTRGQSVPAAERRPEPARPQTETSTA